MDEHVVIVGAGPAGLAAAWAIRRAGRDVLVVGPGNSGVDLLGYLAASDAGRLWLSARSGMTVTPRRLGGVPLHPVKALAGHLVALDRRGMPAFTGAESSPEHPGLWFFGLDSGIYGNMHVRRRQARELARAITG